MILGKGSEPPVAVKVAVAWFTVTCCQIIPRVIGYHFPSVIVQVGEAIVAMSTEAAKKKSGYFLHFTAKSWMESISKRCETPS